METTLGRGRADGLTGRLMAPAAALDGSERLEVRVGRGVSGLQALENDWNSLAEALPEPRFIHRFAWQMACLKHLVADPDSVYQFSFYAAGRVVAIFCLCRVRRTVGGVALWLWELPSHSHITLADPLLVSASLVPSLRRSLVEALDKHVGLPWHAMHFSGLPASSSLLAGLQGHGAGLAVLEPMGQSMSFDCRSTELALAGCSSSFRRNLRRQRKKLEAHGCVTLTLARQGAELEAAFDEFLRLEASGWKGRDGRNSAIRLHPGLAGFYGELSERFSRRGECLIALLRLDGIPIAAQFCLLSGRTLSLQKIAYDEARQSEAPGNQLLHEMLAYACAEPGLDRLSLVTAPAWARGRWNPESQDVWEVYLFNGRPGSWLAWALRRLRHQLPGWAWKTLGRQPSPAVHLQPVSGDR